MTLTQPDQRPRNKHCVKAIEVVAYFSETMLTTKKPTKTAEEKWHLFKATNKVWKASTQQKPRWKKSFSHEIKMAIYLKTNKQKPGLQCLCVWLFLWMHFLIARDIVKESCAEGDHLRFSNKWWPFHRFLSSFAQWRLTKSHKLAGSEDMQGPGLFWWETDKTTTSSGTAVLRVTPLSWLSPPTQGCNWGGSSKSLERNSKSRISNVNKNQWFVISGGLMGDWVSELLHWLDSMTQLTLIYGFSVYIQEECKSPFCPDLKNRFWPQLDKSEIQLSP